MMLHLRKVNMLEERPIRGTVMVGAIVIVQASHPLSNGFPTRANAGN